MFLYKLMENKPIEAEKKKRGRKPKNLVDSTNTCSQENINDTNHIPKKRGRKPKGGTVVNYQECKTETIENSENNVKNIILHLKCRPSDNNNNNNNNNIHEKVIEDYKFVENKSNELNFTELNFKTFNYYDNKDNLETLENLENKEIKENRDKQKNLWNKIESLSNNLHHNLVSDKKCACFHCTYDFDNSPVYIPKFEVEGKYHVYGCFCSPECACAYLMNEKNLDSSNKFERYQLLNYLYCKIYNYKKNIKPAPNPFYTLEKYFGNLTIQEYRQLLKNERLLLIIDKPLVRHLPELHEDNDTYLNYNQNNYSTNSLSYKLSMKTNEQQNKNNIVSQQFAI